MISTTARLIYAVLAFAIVLFGFLVFAQVAAGFGTIGTAIGFCLVISGGWKAVETAVEVWSIS